MRPRPIALLAAAILPFAVVACSTGNSTAPSDPAAATSDAEMKFGAGFVLQSLTPESTLAEVTKADTGVKTDRVVDMVIGTIPDDVASPTASGSSSASPSGSGSGSGPSASGSPGNEAAKALGEAGVLACVVVGRTDGAKPGTVPSWAIVVTNAELYYWVPAADCREVASVARSAPTPTASDGAAATGQAGLPANAIAVTDESFTQVALAVPSDQLTQGGAALVAQIKEAVAATSSPSGGSPGSAAPSTTPSGSGAGATAPSGAGSSGSPSR